MDRLQSIKQMQVRLTPMLTLAMAVEIIQDEMMDDFGLTKLPLAATLKVAARTGRLAAVQHGGIWFTTRPALREYLRQYDPKNRSGNRARKRIRSKKAKQQYVILEIGLDDPTDPDAIYQELLDRHGPFLGLAATKVHLKKLQAEASPDQRFEIVQAVNKEIVNKV